MYEGEEFYTARDDFSFMQNMSPRTEFSQVQSKESAKNGGNLITYVQTKTNQHNEKKQKRAYTNSDYEILIDVEKKNFCSSCSCNNLCLIF